MRSVIFGAITSAAAQLGHVELKGSNVPSNQVSDVLLGQVLADQLRVAPKADMKAAEIVGKWSSTMFEKPETVLLAVIDGADSSGVTLTSECTPVKECVGETCYGTTSTCVAHNLMSQSATALAHDLTSTVPHSSLVGISSDAGRGSVAGEGNVAVLAQDKDAQVKVTAVTDNVQMDSKAPLDLAEVSSVMAPLQPLAQMELSGKDLKVTVAQQTAALDTTASCVRLVLGEAAAMVQAPPASLVVMTPRSGACMRAKYGDSSAEAKVASALLLSAAQHVEAKLQAGRRSFSAIVSLPSAAAGAAAESPIAAALIEAKRRLAAADEPTAKGYSSASVANFHIYGWTTLAVALSLVACAYTIMGMTNDRDPLLYAKFRPEVDSSRR
jgi:hypothetical protein